MDYRQTLKDRLSESLDPEMQARYKTRRKDAIAQQDANFQSPEAVDALADGQRSRALMSGLARAANKFGSVGGDGGQETSVPESMKGFDTAAQTAFEGKRDLFDRGVKAEDNAQGALDGAADRNTKLAGDIDSAERAGTMRGREDADYKRTQDVQADEDKPDSEVSRTLQALATKYTRGARDFSTMSATQLKALSPGLARMYEIEEQTQAKRAAAESSRMSIAASAAERADARAAASAERESARAAASSERRATKDDEYDRRREDKAVDEKKKGDEKFQKEDQEFNQRFVNIEGNLKDLEDLIDKNGTVEVFGPASGMMNSKIYQVALDYAKIVDPGSVAREGEVASAQKYMLPIQGLFTRNSTAKASIAEFRSDLQKKMASKNANVRGAKAPSGLDGNQGGGGGPKVYGAGEIPEAD